VAGFIGAMRSPNRAVVLVGDLQGPAASGDRGRGRSAWAKSPAVLINGPGTPDATLTGMTVLFPPAMYTVRPSGAVARATGPGPAAGRQQPWDPGQGVIEVEMVQHGYHRDQVSLSVTGRRGELGRSRTGGWSPAGPG